MEKNHCDTKTEHHGMETTRKILFAFKVFFCLARQGVALWGLSSLSMFNMMSTVWPKQSSEAVSIHLSIKLFLTAFHKKCVYCDAIKKYSKIHSSKFVHHFKSFKNILMIIGIISKNVNTMGRMIVTWFSTWTWNAVRSMSTLMHCPPCKTYAHQCG